MIRDNRTIFKEIATIVITGNKITLIMILEKLYGVHVIRASSSSYENRNLKLKGFK